MAISFFNEGAQPPADNTNYYLNEFQFKKFDDEHILVTTDHGGWVVLNKEEFNLLRYDKVNENKHLFDLLVEKGIIITSDNVEFIKNCYRQKVHHTTNGANLHILVPTLRCNHKCVYCHAKSFAPDKQGFDMTEKTAKKVVDFIFQSPGQHYTIEFQGGEPLLNFPIIKVIFEYATELNKTHKKELFFIAVTNLTAMTPEIKKYFLDNKIAICSSLDGPKELHDAHRKYYDHASSYDEVIPKIKEMKQHVSFSVLPTTTRKSFKYGKKIVDEYMKQGFYNISSRNLNVAGFAKDEWKLLGYTPEEFIKYWKEIFNYILELNKKGTRFIETKIATIVQRIVTTRARTFTCFGAPCGALISQIAYKENGDIHVCDESRSMNLFCVGNVHTHTYAEIIKKSRKLLGHTCGVNTLCEACIYHPFCGICAVGTYEGQGNIPPKLAIDHECQIRKAMMDYIFEKLIYDPQAREILLDWAIPNRRKNRLRMKNAPN